jgi:hypothetical protein
VKTYLSGVKMRIYMATWPEPGQKISIDKIGKREIAFLLFPPPTTKGVVTAIL